MVFPEVKFEFMEAEGVAVTEAVFVGISFPGQVVANGTPVMVVGTTAPDDTAISRGFTTSL